MMTDIINNQFNIKINSNRSGETLGGFYFVAKATVLEINHQYLGGVQNESDY